MSKVSKPVESFMFHADLWLRVWEHKSGEMRIAIRRSGGITERRDWMTDQKIERLYLWLGKYLAWKRRRPKMVSYKEVRAHLNAVSRSFEATFGGRI